MVKVKLLEFPKDKQWRGVYARALVTVGKDLPKQAPSFAWRQSILRARHSPIRYLRFSFYLELPYWVSVHLCRHVHAQPYVRSQRNDRQDGYDRNSARQDAPVSMIWDMNAEELITIMQKRLCGKAASETREVATKMRTEVERNCPEFAGFLTPPCWWQGGVCMEMKPCGENSVLRGNLKNF